uniref:Nin one binding (NOB1) Zn-ribbon-like domain-containing protein n=1 Tax=Haptolina ericina TaxID=156174 RepID=A0A7S3BW65_9EUKA
MRCSGCFKQEPDLSKAFCSKCGNTSLVRLASVVDSSGRQRLLPEGRAPARVRSTNVRGTKYPMPKPQVGRNAKNLMLAEDQMAEAADKLRRQGKIKTVNVFDPDYDMDSHFGRKGKKGNGIGNALQVGFGKRNPNDVRSRPKRT